MVMSHGGSENSPCSVPEVTDDEVSPSFLLGGTTRCLRIGSANIDGKDIEANK